MKNPGAWIIWRQHCSVPSRKTRLRPSPFRRNGPRPPPSRRTWPRLAPSRRTWLHPFLGKFHISVQLPRFSAPSRSPDVNIESVKCLNIQIFKILHKQITSWLTPFHEFVSPSSSSSTSVTTAPFWPESDTHLVWVDIIRQFNKIGSLLRYLTGIRHPPEVLRIESFDINVCSSLTCKSLGLAGQETSRICDLCVCFYLSIPGSR